MGYSNSTSNTPEAASVEIPFDMPVIDYAAMHGSPEERAKWLDELDKGFQTYGFVYLANSSIPQEMVDKAFEWSRRLFALPLDVKMKAKHPAYETPYSHRGYAPQGVGHTVQLLFDPDEIDKTKITEPEIKETFELGNGMPDSGLVPNNWVPEEDLPGFRAFHERWFVECTKLAQSLLRCLGEVLKLEDKDLLCKQESKHDAHISLMHYPNIPVEPLRSGKKSRLNAHSDYGSLTMLFQGEIGGLEVHDGEVYKPIVPKKGTVILNVGDMLERQTNGRWKSSLHRVTAPREIMLQEGYDPNATVVDRYTIVYFCQPNADVVIDNFPGCEKAGRWKPNMIGDWEEKMTSLEWLHKRYTAEFH
ncbi:2-oxoglutarate-dependent dioxygenase lolO1 [Cladobotryum mycophilum]|uniref:2-oxoglutarate-dependent dioxygenase lolO1 n=1 Tax=Cladobotryum mycophilum TaxID=491253 RepID=A0ABR0SBP4_9HYPO